MQTNTRSLKQQYTTWLEKHVAYFDKQCAKQAARFNVYYWQAFDFDNLTKCQKELSAISKSSKREVAEYLCAYAGCTEELAGYFLSTQLGIDAIQPTIASSAQIALF